MVTFYGDGFAPLEIPSNLIWSAIGVGLLIPLALYVLRAIGLFVLAKKREIKHAYLAFLPFVWIYIVCKLVAETRFLKSTAGYIVRAFNPCL